MNIEHSNAVSAGANLSEDGLRSHKAKQQRMAVQSAEVKCLRTCHLTTVVDPGVNDREVDALSA